MICEIGCEEPCRIIFQNIILSGIIIGILGGYIFYLKYLKEDKNDTK